MDTSISIGIYIIIYPINNDTYYGINNIIYHRNSTNNNKKDNINCVNTDLIL